MTTTAPRTTSTGSPAPNPVCPECRRPARWMPAPLGRWVCQDCAISWRALDAPGLREDPHQTAAAPLEMS
ncbi:hypothetical protein REH65_33080 (plasmid) [Saccharopolyspora sp. ID03-671]|uniref:hypothetical protein n=1 Tax=Saccharopolyspora sp. ID03-671 TaxID=3073066 RepID=UPI0032471356